MWMHLCKKMHVWNWTPISYLRSHLPLTTKYSEKWGISYASCSGEILRAIYRNLHGFQSRARLKIVRLHITNCSDIQKEDLVVFAIINLGGPSLHYVGVAGYALNSTMLFAHPCVIEKDCSVLQCKYLPLSLWLKFEPSRLCSIHCFIGVGHRLERPWGQIWGAGLEGSNLIKSGSSQIIIEWLVLELLENEVADMGVVWFWRK